MKSKRKSLPTRLVVRNPTDIEIMEIILDCFFDKVFSELERSSLLARYKRRSLVDYFNTVIAGCARAECSEAKGVVCRKAIITTIKYHEKSLKENGSVCLMGKYHNILYVAAKICFDWQLQDTPTVACLLDNIFQCEKTFERLLIGALFGTTAPHFIAGWKSDFKDQEENVTAMVYFLCHAIDGCLEYEVEGNDGLTKFIDVPIQSCGKATPIKIILQLGRADILLILLRFGAVVLEDAQTSGLETLLEKLKEYKGVYPFNLVACLKLLLRVIIRVRIEPLNTTSIPGSNIDRDGFNDRFPTFVKDGLVPESRCGMKPPELKHLCRCAVRYRLWQNFQLPNGIRKLPLPDALHSYLDILVD